MRNNPFIILPIAACLWTTAPWPLFALSVDWWVSPAGSPRPDGTVDRPFDSPNNAWRRWQENQATTNSLRLILRGGQYYLNQPIILGNGPAQSDSSRLDIVAAPGEHPLLSGGVTVNHWALLASSSPALPPNARGQVWFAPAPSWAGHVLPIRQLWINAAKAVRAREPNEDCLARLIAWNKTNQTATISAHWLPNIREPQNLEMVVDQVWEIAILRLQSLNFQGGDVQLTFKPPESQIEFLHPWPPVTVNSKYQAPFYLGNALEFLDSPGEWFEDVAAAKIYYWPRPGQDLTTATVIAPALETLLQGSGSAAHPLGNLHLQGITFAHTAWLRPGVAGHVPLQATMPMLAARKLSPKGTPYHPKLDNVAWIDRPPAAVAFQYATNITFENCTFEHMASAGLDLGDGCRDVLVQGCTFRDIGGNGLQLGRFSAASVETHTPYNPLDDHEVCQAVMIRDNLVTHCGTEDWGAAGIAAGYVRQVVIAHNDLSTLPYSGISLGWGWTKLPNALRDNRVFANHIHHVGLRLGDLGGIYTLSAQPGTVISENLITDIVTSPYVQDPQHWFYLYADEGSSGITWRDNWCPTHKFLQNANGPGNIWTNNGPEVSAQIKNAAGLEPAFQYLLK